MKSNTHKRSTWQTKTTDMVHNTPGGGAWPQIEGTRLRALWRLGCKTMFGLHGKWVLALQDRTELLFNIGRRIDPEQFSMYSIALKKIKIYVDRTSKTIQVRRQPKQSSNQTDIATAKLIMYTKSREKKNMCWYLAVAGASWETRRHQDAEGRFVAVFARLAAAFEPRNTRIRIRKYWKRAT